MNTFIVGWYAKDFSDHLIGKMDKFTNLATTHNTFSESSFTAHAFHQKPKMCAYTTTIELRVSRKDNKLSVHLLSHPVLKVDNH